MTETRSTRRTVCFLGIAVLTVVVGSVALGGAVTAQDATNETLTVNATVQDHGTVLANGTANASGETTTITVAVTEGPSADAYENATTDNVSEDGQWNATLNASEMPAEGTYVLEASTNDTTATTEFDVSADLGGANVTTPENGTETESPTGNETETAPDAGNETATDTEPADGEMTETDDGTADTAGDTETGETDGQDGPGFGVIAALLGVVGTVVLARRR